MTPVQSVILMVALSAAGGLCLGCAMGGCPIFNKWSERRKLKKQQSMDIKHSFNSADSFAPLPKGKEYLNPLKLSPAQVEVAEGYRLLTVYERIPKDAEYYSRGSAASAVWLPSGYIGEVATFQSSDTYRTRTPFPWVAACPFKVGESVKHARLGEYTIDRIDANGYCRLTSSLYIRPDEYDHWVHVEREDRSAERTIEPPYRKLAKHEMLPYDADVWDANELAWMPSSRPKMSSASLAGPICIYRTRTPAPVETVAFPAPPAGEKWSNYHNLTPEQLEVQAGHRLLLESEYPPEKHGLGKAVGVRIDVWDGRGWLNNATGNCSSCNTYRTLAPLPSRKVPLTQDDVEPGDIVSCATQRGVITTVQEDGFFAMGRFYNWQEAQRQLLRKVDGEWITIRRSSGSLGNVGIGVGEHHFCSEDCLRKQVIPSPFKAKGKAK